MPLTYEAAKRLFNSGEFSLLVESSDLSEGGLHHLEARQQALIAYALAQIGDVVGARRLARLLNQGDAPPILRSEAHLALGIASESDGEMADALEHLQLSLRFANFAKDDLQIARAQLRLFRHAIDTCSSEVLTGMLSQVRRAVTRAGNTQVTAYLHLCLAAIEGQSGRVVEAWRHCDRADELLALEQNAWLTVNNLTNRTCLALLECDFARAARYIADAKPYLGNERRLSSTDHNLAHLQIITGQFDKAFKTLDVIAAVGSGNSGRWIPEILAPSPERLAD